MNHMLGWGLWGILLDEDYDAYLLDEYREAYLLDQDCEACFGMIIRSNLDVPGSNREKNHAPTKAINVPGCKFDEKYCPSIVDYMPNECW